MSAIAPFAPPQYLFVEITSECNLRCKHCQLWQTTEPAGTLRTSEKLGAVREFASFARRPTVVLTGGETTSKREEFFALTRLCRELGVSSAANTNGTLIGPGVVERLVTEGPRYLVVSLDSHRAEVHDYVRGVPGTFERATGLIRALARAASGRADRPRILTNLVVCDLNVSDLREYVVFVRELGADAVLFQMLARTFALRGERDAFFERHLPRDVNAFDAAMDDIVAARAEGLPIETTPADFAWMKRYVRAPDFVGEQVCGSHERNIMLNMHGDVQLCFAMRSLLGGRVLGNVRERSLRSMWEGELAAEARGTMANCRKNCGMLACHRRTA